MPIAVNLRRNDRPADIAACCEPRRSNETRYRELKHTMLGAALTLRSQTVEGVCREIWGSLTAYNLIRPEIAKASLIVKCEPPEVRFIRALHRIQFELHWAVTRSYGKLPQSMRHLRERLVSLLIKNGPVENSTGPSRADLEKMTLVR